jgi:phage shock protein E
MISIFGFLTNNGSGSAASPSPAAASASGPIKTAIADISADKAVLIDVRTAEEYTSGHAARATNFDVTRIQAGEMPTVAKTAKVYLYCRSGHRAGLALEAMKAAGFTDVTNLGGFQAWLDAGGSRG